MPANTFENLLTGLPEDSSLPISAVINLNMATLNFLTENIEEANLSIQKAISQISFNGDVNALAYSLIYLNLRKGDTESAMKIIK